MAVDLFGKDLITTQEWSVKELKTSLDLAKKFKDQYKRSGTSKILKDKTFFMLFYGPSTRTRAAFEAGMTNLGGHGIFIDVSTTRIGAGEAVKDVAKMYERYGHGLGVRVLDESIDYMYGKGVALVRQFAEHADIPVINMACCSFHPTQGLADIMTIKEQFGKIKNKKYVIMWGHAKKFRGRCSIQEEMLIASRFGMDVVVAHPPGFGLDSKVVKWSEQNAASSGGSIEFSHDYRSALEGAHVVFPRNWASEELVKLGASKFADREVEIHKKYSDWILTKDLVNLMDKKAIVTHVLPVLRGEEATDDAMDGKQSVIYDQAENGLYTKMAVLALTMGKKSYK